MTGMRIAGPVVLYGQFVSLLLVNFFLFPTLLLTGRHREEDVWRQSGLLCMCLTIVVELAWTSLHPRPLPLASAAGAACAASAAHLAHLLIAFDLVRGPEYTMGLALAFQFATSLPWVLVTQVGTAF